MNPDHLQNTPVITRHAGWIGSNSRKIPSALAGIWDLTDPRLGLLMTSDFIIVNSGTPEELWCVTGVRGPAHFPLPDTFPVFHIIKLGLVAWEDGGVHFQLESHGNKEQAEHQEQLLQVAPEVRVSVRRARDETDSARFNA